VFVLGRPSDEKLAQVLDSVRGAPVTYGEVGATLGATPGEPLPAGYHHARAAEPLGHGDDAFAAACAGIRQWRLHRGQGFRVVSAAPPADPPADPPIAVGTEVVVDAPIAGPVHVLAACRIVAVVDEPDRYGFAYGTLPVHPESGEEAFLVERTDGDEVRAVVTAFSRPRHPLVRLGGPVARRQQARATQGYLAALAAHVRDVLA
jgi:uncharacterized protein (UPF0548 family)